jgi:LPXTG-motif cell wall-anchored protein
VRENPWTAVAIGAGLGLLLGGLLIGRRRLGGPTVQ